MFNICFSVLGKQMEQRSRGENHKIMYEYEDKANGKAICSNTYRNRNEKWVEKWIIGIRKIYDGTIFGKREKGYVDLNRGNVFK